MKELTIEQKAKAYDKVTKEVKDFFEGRHKMSSDVTRTLEYLFPELVETDDERIRKGIIRNLEYLADRAEGFVKVELSERIAWLEKQGGHKSTDKIQIGKEYKCIASPRYTTFMTGKIYKPEDKFLCSLMNFCSDCFEPKEDSEQIGLASNTDKVEPKFHEGEWVVSPNGVYWHIDAIQNGRYQVSSNLGMINDWSLEANIYHSFTIQDAKDGDVLTWDNNKCIALFKNIYDEESFNSHGFVGHCTNIFETRMSYHDIEGAHPATKEQRDLLFAKMEEAGYMWDSKNKELQEIEQNPTDNSNKVEPKFKVGNIIHCKLDNRTFVIKEVDLKKGVYIYTEKGCGNDINYADEMFELVEPNPYSGTSFVYNNHTWGMCARDGGVDILCDSKLIKHIGEQKPDERKEFVLASFGTDIKLENDTIIIPEGCVATIDDNKIYIKKEGKGALEAIKEEKVENAIKAEPKFKVGDIVQYITDSTDRRKIEEVDTWCNMYHTDSSPIMFEIEDEWKVVVNAEDIEQNPTDKIETKFKFGDWVIRADGEYFSNGSKFAQITDIDKGCYWLDSGKWIEDRDIKLWSIDYADYGDVLAVSWWQDKNLWEKIIIFKKYHNEGVEGLYSMPCVEGYGNTFKNGKLAINEEVPYYSKTWTCNLHPATKEQRDLLFSKMKEAGYEWVNEKKELKKIE